MGYRNPALAGKFMLDRLVAKAMRVIRYTATAVMLALLVVLAACSTSNEGVLPAPARDASGAFAVTALKGQGTFTPSLLVTERDNAVAVAVSAENAQNLSGAFLHVHYDASR